MFTAECVSHAPATTRQRNDREADFCFNFHRPCAYFALCRSNGNPNVIENFYQRVAPNEELRVLPNDSTETTF